MPRWFGGGNLGRKCFSQANQMFKNTRHQLSRIRSQLFRFQNNCSKIVPVPEQSFHNCSELFRFQNNRSKIVPIGTRTFVPNTGNCSDCSNGTILEQLFRLTIVFRQPWIDRTYLSTSVVIFCCHQSTQVSISNELICRCGKW